MKFSTTKGFRAPHAWGALDLGAVDGVSVRAHWTDRPYHWHVNDGAEVFGVLQGQVTMHWRDKNSQEHCQQMNPGDFCHAEQGDCHVAHPNGEALVLVIERQGSE
jgi:mannose-6-phosphate isomerase-like protein (cupin superfamily)